MYLNDILFPVEPVRSRLSDAIGESDTVRTTSFLNDPRILSRVQGRRELSDAELSKVERIMKCSECNYATTKIYNLKRHLSAKHNIGEKFTCELCPVDFPERYQLKEHLKWKHNQDLHGNAIAHEDLELRCHRCYALFTRTGALKEHLTHCSQCIVTHCT